MTKKRITLNIFPDGFKKALGPLYAHEKKAFNLETSQTRPFDGAISPRMVQA